MLAIQTFILSNTNWEELLGRAPYNLKIKWKGPLVMFNYIQWASMPCEIVNEARGLILDSSNNFSVVRMSFYRFYNMGEPGAATIDSNSMYALEKIDGTLVMFYYYNGWHYSTRSTFDADDAFLSNGTSFGDLCRRAIRNSNIVVEELNKDFTYSFELVSPESQIVIPYKETKLYYLMARNNKTLVECYISRDWPTVKIIDVSSLEQIKDYVSQFDGKEFEGVVVVDKYGNRLKVKNLNWLKIHKLYNNGVLSNESILEMIKNGEDKEFLTYFPEKEPLFNEMRIKMIEMEKLGEALDSIDFKSVFEEKKNFALAIKNEKKVFQTLLFKAYDSCAGQWIKEMDGKKLWEFIGKVFE